MGLIGLFSDAQIGAFGIDDHQCFMIPFDAGSVFGVSVDTIVAFLEVLGLFTMVEYAQLDAESAASLVDSFGSMFIKLTSGVTNIRPQRDRSNLTIHDTPLPCLPFYFCKMREEKFFALVFRMRSRLESKFTAKDTNDLESEHWEFCRGIRGEVVPSVLPVILERVIVYPIK